MLGAITFIRRYSKVRRKGKEKEKRVIYRRGLWFSRAYPLTVYYERNLYTLARVQHFPLAFVLQLLCFPYRRLGSRFRDWLGKMGSFPKIQQPRCQNSFVRWLRRPGFCSFIVFPTTVSFGTRRLLNLLFYYSI